MTSHGRTRTGRWSVDADGHVVADVGRGGREERARAWVAGDVLTIASSTGALTLHRFADA